MNRLQAFYHKTMNPDMYHGQGKAPPFFEGWYFKVITADEEQRYAIIPGIFKGEGGHAFIQVLNGQTAHSVYHVFPVEAFWSAEKGFEIRIGDNTFSRDNIKLAIDRPAGQISGELHFEGLTPWPVTLRQPGIMGWYAWVPKMECYHGVVSLDHGLSGQLRVNGRGIDFENGRGYIEKDWGQSFPSAYVWMQTNHFEEPEISLTASTAMIPWVRSAFRGFIVGFWDRGRLYRFATYTGAKTEDLVVDDHKVNWTIVDRDYRLEIVARRLEGGLLQAPSRESMLQRVEETMRATVDLRLATRQGELIFEGQGRNAALEVYGDLPTLLSAA